MSLQTINTPRDTTFNTTESTPRNIADAIAEELHGIAQVLDPAASDYDALSNKPQVNGVTLSGNKTSKQLGIRQTIPLTSAQYAQLTSAEKMDVDKDYIITDENATAAPIDDNSVSRNSVWSSYKVDEELSSLNSALTGLSGKFAYVSGTMASAINTEVNIPYPQGFSDSSGFIIAGITSRNSNSYWYLNNPDVSCFGDNANVRVKTTNNGFLNQPFKVLLIKL